MSRDLTDAFRAHRDAVPLDMANRVEAATRDFGRTRHACGLSFDDATEPALMQVLIGVLIQFEHLPDAVLKGIAAGTQTAGFVTAGLARSLLTARRAVEECVL